MKHFTPSISRIEDALAHNSTSVTTSDLMLLAQHETYETYETYETLRSTIQANSIRFKGDYYAYDLDAWMEHAEGAEQLFLRSIQGFCYERPHEIDIMAEFDKWRQRGRNYRKAKAAGLNRPELYSGNTSTEPYKVWEAMSVRNGLGDRYGYDSCGCYGISPQHLEKLWFLSGCRNSGKFRGMVGLVQSYLKKGKRYDDISHIVWVWKKSDSWQDILHKWAGCMANRRWTLKPGQYKTLGRIKSGAIRAAMLHDLYRDPIEDRRGYYALIPQLNFDLAAKVQQALIEGRSLIGVLPNQVILDNGRKAWAKADAEILKGAEEVAKEGVVERILSMIEDESMSIVEAMQEARKLIQTHWITDTCNYSVEVMWCAIKIGCTTIDRGRAKAAYRAHRWTPSILFDMVRIAAYNIGYQLQAA